MTVLKFLAIGAVSAIGYAALRLSKRAVTNAINNFNFTVGIPRPLGLVSFRYLRLRLPIDLFNYTGYNVSAQRLKVRLVTRDEKGTESLLAISPVTPSITLPTDVKTSLSFDVDIDPFSVFSVKATTPIRVYTEFDELGQTLSIPYDFTIAQFIPQSVREAVNKFLGTFGISLSGVKNALIPAALNGEPPFIPYYEVNDAITPTDTL